MSIGLLIAAILLGSSGCFSSDIPENKDSSPLSGESLTRPQGFNTYQLVTGDDTEDDRRQWDAIYSTQRYVYGKEPASFLESNVAHLPLGRVLDIAMGEGRNAVFLAKKGFQVEGVDLSDVAIRKAQLLAKEHRVKIYPMSADLAHYKIKPNRYDVILNIQYLQRSLIPQIKAGLKQGGVVVFESYTVDQIKNAGGKSLRRDQLLQKNELKKLFSDFEILVYEEKNDGKEAAAYLIARKP